VLVKGADYEIGQIVGADLVLSYGGEVLRAPIQAGHSTTGIVARMSGSGAQPAG
jgi:D-beta-D-heptose 7-phosphate kinase/D-beta-D-heptose 1-phosphate adenosyltransferase